MTEKLSIFLYVLGTLLVIAGIFFNALIYVVLYDMLGWY